MNFTGMLDTTCINRPENLKPKPRQTRAKTLVDPLELIIHIQKGECVKWYIRSLWQPEGNAKIFLLAWLILQYGYRADSDPNTLHEPNLTSLACPPPKHSCRGKKQPIRHEFILLVFICHDIVRCTHQGQSALLLLLLFWE